MKLLCGFMSFALVVLILVNFFCLYGEKDIARQKNLIILEVVLFFMFVGSVLLSKLFF